MKLVRFGDPDREKPGLLDSDGALRDLSKIVPDIHGATLVGEARLALARAVEGESLPVVHHEVRLGPCVGGIGKIICVGLNYHGHIREVDAAVPAEPVLFMKATSALCGPYDNVVLPCDASAVDWEVELGVVVGSRAKHVSREQALQHVAGYCIVNDISERNWQLQGTGQWVKGKSADTFAPLGPWLVTPDEIPDPQALTLQLKVNGEVQQWGETADMVFGVAEILSYISRFMTLLPGDVICTGTPRGVGMGRTPPRYLRAGDVMDLCISGLGVQRQCVVGA